MLVVALPTRYSELSPSPGAGVGWGSDDVASVQRGDQHVRSYLCVKVPLKRLILGGPF